MAGWRNKAEKLAKGRWIRFSAEEPTHEITFMGEPTEVEKTSTIGERKGEKYKVMSFPVMEDNEEKILEPNNSLLKLLIEEDAEEEIIGGTFMIKCLDLQRKQQWKVKRLVEKSENIKQNWKGESKEAVEEEEEKQEKEDVTKNTQEKKKFMQEVEKRTKSRKKGKTPSEEEMRDIEPDRETETAENS